MGWTTSRNYKEIRLQTPAQQRASSVNWLHKMVAGAIGTLSVFLHKAADTDEIPSELRTSAYINIKKALDLLKTAQAQLQMDNIRIAKEKENERVNRTKK